MEGGGVGRHDGMGGGEVVGKWKGKRQGCVHEVCIIIFACMFDVTLVSGCYRIMHS